MRRIHLFELEDQPWFPATVRDAATAYLRLAVDVSGHARLLVPKLADALRRTGAKRIIDLCSGGAGPLPPVVKALEEQGLDVRVSLSDRFPNVSAFREIAARSQGRIDYLPEPVDATAVPRSLDGFLTLFNAFHHFRPERARAILADAADAGRPIAVFEIVGRSPFTLLGILITPFLMLLAMPFVRPFHWSWLFFTYLVPLVPLVGLWDGLVSCLRVYSLEELEAMVREIRVPHYEWELGRIRLGAAPAFATYLIGTPTR
jgi:hypothetical protein